MCKGQRWPINTMNRSAEEESPNKKNVRFSDSPDVREFSASQDSDIDLVSGEYFAVTNI